MKWIYRKVQSHFYKKFRRHLVVEIKGHYYDHDNSLGWRGSDIDCYIFGLDTAIDVIEEAWK